MTFTEQLAETKARGWRVAFWQREDWTFAVTLYLHDGSASEHGYGITPELALGRAIDVAKVSKHFHPKPKAPPAAPLFPCNYCNGSGWFYSDPDLGPCGCRPVPAMTANFDDLV